MNKELLEWIKTIVISVVIAFVITQFVRPTLVKGYSMYPTLNEHDYLIINKIPYMMHEPERGDIVVFKSHLEMENGKKKDLIKRVIGVKGDTVKVVNGDVFVNDEKVEESYIPEGYTPGDVEIEVSENKVFVMGDNRVNSIDSRDDRVGLVDVNALRGKVLVRLYPFTKIGKVN